MSTSLDSIKKVEPIDDSAGELINAGEFQVQVYNSDRRQWRDRDCCQSDYFPLGPGDTHIKINHISGVNQFCITLHDRDTGNFLEYVHKNGPGSFIYDFETLVQRWTKPERQNFALAVVQRR